MVVDNTPVDRQQDDRALSLLLCVAQRLLPHRTLGEIRDWRSANLRKRKAAAKPRQRPQQQREKLSTSGSGTLARRPAMKRKPSSLNPCQLVTSDDLFQDSLWGGSAKPQKPRAGSAAEVKGPAAAPLKPAAAKPAAQQQQSVLSRQQAAPTLTQQPQQQPPRSASESRHSSAVEDPSRSAAALLEQSMQPVSKKARLQQSESDARPAADTSPPHSVGLEPQPFSTPLLLRRDSRGEIPDWSLAAQQPPMKAEEPDSETEPALSFSAAQPPQHQQEPTQQQGAFSEVEVIGQSTERKGQLEARQGLVSKGLQEAEPRQQQDEGLGSHVPAAAESGHMSDMDAELSADPLFHQYETMQEDSAAERMPASMLPRAPSAKPEEATQLSNAPGWIYQAAPPMPALV